MVDILGGALVPSGSLFATFWLHGALFAFASLNVDGIGNGAPLACL